MSYWVVVPHICDGLFLYRTVFICRRSKDDIRPIVCGDRQTEYPDNVKEFSVPRAYISFFRDDFSQHHLPADITTRPTRKTEIQPKTVPLRVNTLGRDTGELWNEEV